MKTFALLSLVSFAAAADDDFVKCKTNSDCPNDGMYAGTCCGRSIFSGGDPDVWGKDWKSTNIFQIENPSMGLCNAAGTLDFGGI